MANLILDVKEMKGNFFANAAMIGIAAAEQGYRMCWILNKYFDTGFVNVPENTICMNAGGGSSETVSFLADSTQSLAFPNTADGADELFFFPTYLHQFPNSAYKYMLYQLKCGKKPLLPEIKHLDFLLLLQTANSSHDSHLILEGLRKIPEVQMAQELKSDQIKKNIANLLV